MRSRMPLTADTWSRGTASAAVLLVVAACFDAEAPTMPDEPLPDSALQRIACTADVRAGTLECPDPTLGPAPGLSLSLTLGGQGIYVQLTSSGVTYDGTTELFEADVTVQNLIGQALGTTDGTTLAAEGVRVFFHSGPTVTEGSGTVTVANATGAGTFTASDQPYFQYDEVLDPNETSAALTWQWNVPPTVVTFAFEVFVTAPVEHPDGWIEVTPANAILDPGATLELTATARDALGRAVVAGPGGITVSWSLSPGTSASLTSGTTLIAEGQSTTSNTLTAGDVEGTETVTVTLDVNVTSGTATIDVIDQSVVCDGGFALDSSDPLEAAFAIGVCKVAQDAEDWGLVSASWVLADGSPPPTDPDLAANFHLGHGIRNDFGPFAAPQQGAQLLILSSGKARAPSDPGYVHPSSDGGFSKGFTGSYPEGFPQSTPVCPVQGGPLDPAGLQVTLRAPQGATGFSVQFRYYTADYPDWMCTQYVDQFVTMLSPLLDLAVGNVAFDELGNIVNANSPGTVTHCAATAATPIGLYSCPNGPAELQGTGYDDHGASSWMTATAPVDPGSEVTLRFAIYDSSDGVFDALVLVDNFRWVSSP